MPPASTSSPHPNGVAREGSPPIGLFSAFTLVVANMIGTGIFTTSGFIMKELGNPWAMLGCWTLGGLFALSGALCYGELGSRFPHPGGEYVFLRESLGEGVAFLSGWISLLVGFSAPIAAAAMAFAAYVWAGWGGAPAWTWTWTWSGVTLVTLSPLTILACGLVLTFAVVHRHSLSLGSQVQNVLTWFKVSLIMVFLVGGLVWGQGSLSHFGEAPPLRLFFSGPFAVSLIFITFAYSGWNAAAYMGSEIARPTRNIPLALVGGTLFVTLLYILLNVTFLYALAPPEMSGVLEVGERAALVLFGTRISRIVSLAVAFCLLSLVSAMMMTGPRVYLAMARDGLLFDGISRLSGRHGTPDNAIRLQAGLAVVMVLTTSFENLLLFIGFMLSLFSLLTVAGLIIIRRRPDAPEAPYKTLGYPVPAVLFILGNLWIIGFSLISRPFIALWGLAALLAGLGLRAFFRNRAPTPTGTPFPPDDV